MQTILSGDCGKWINNREGDWGRAFMCVIACASSDEWSLLVLVVGTHDVNCIERDAVPCTIPFASVIHGLSVVGTLVVFTRIYSYVSLYISFSIPTSIYIYTYIYIYEYIYIYIYKYTFFIFSLYLSLPISLSLSLYIYIYIYHFVCFDMFRCILFRFYIKIGSYLFNSMAGITQFNS